MSEPIWHLVVSRRGIVHGVQSLADDAATACGKGARDLVLIGGVGVGERMCHVCRLKVRSDPFVHYDNWALWSHAVPDIAGLKVTDDHAEVTCGSCLRALGQQKCEPIETTPSTDPRGVTP